MENALSIDQQKFLLDLARRTIDLYLEKGKSLKEKADDPLLLEKRGAFVTLTLLETILDCAIAAATQDFRFTSLKKEELSRLKIEISVLTLPKKIKDPREIKIGDHGIIVSKGPNRGLLLPQVPVEWDWDLETYLNHGCLKAGLAEDEWEKGATIEVFSAQVFSE
jgi:uncharacterized protein (TIGR00296 family)